jgi:copper transporter 1
MLFTWSTQDLCIVFEGWHITGTASLVFSLLAIVLMTAGYEAVREMSRRYELYAKRVGEGRRDGDDLRGESISVSYIRVKSSGRDAGKGWSARGRGRM